MSNNTITGTVQTTRTNDYGYTSYKVQGTWYGSDAKGAARASEGETVSFEAFNKAGKDGRSFPTLKLATLAKVTGTPSGGNGALRESGTPVSGSSASTGTGSAKSGVASHSNGGTRDSYWADKATEDAKKDPRIVYQSSYERALGFVRLAIDCGAFKALEKAKESAKLGVLEAFVNEQADKIMVQVYAAKIPEVKTEAKPVKAPAEPETADTLDTDDSAWS